MQKPKTPRLTEQAPTPQQAGYKTQEGVATALRQQQNKVETKNHFNLNQKVLLQVKEANLIDRISSFLSI